MKKIILDTPAVTTTLTIGDACNDIRNGGHTFVVYRTANDGCELATLMYVTNSNVWGWQYISNQSVLGSSRCLKYEASSLEAALYKPVAAGREVVMLDNIIDYTQYLADFYKDTRRCVILW